MGIGIEVSNDEIGGEWHVSDQSFEILVELCHDIAVRNNLLPLRHGVNLFGHNECAATSCPGPYLGSRLDELCDRVNNFGKAKEEPKTEPVVVPEPVIVPEPEAPKEEPKEEIKEEPKEEKVSQEKTEDKKPVAILSEEGSGIIYEMNQQAEQIKETKITGVLPHAVYEILRWVLWTVIPAASVLLTTLTKTWGWEIPLEPILISASGVSLFIGTILGIAKLSNDKK